MASLLTAPTTQLVDGNGNPLSGGKVYTYVTGASLTPKAAYTDASAGTPLSNPVVLDSNGSAEIWLSGAYRIRVYSAADVLLYDVDDVAADASASTTFVDNAFEIVDNSDATKKIQFQVSSLTTGTTRVYTWPDKNGTVAMLSDIGGSVNCYQVTDTTDIALAHSGDATPYSTIGSTVSAVIPTKGIIQLALSAQVITATVDNGIIIGVRIGSTNYFPSTLSKAYFGGSGTTVGAHDYGGLSNINVPQSNQFSTIDIEVKSVPTGSQTIQIVAYRQSNGGTVTLKGTVVTTRIYISLLNHA